MREYVVGFASSMEKVLPREMPPGIEVQSSATLSLARNESEGFQVVVVPFGKGLEQVRISVGELRGKDGAALSADAIDVRVVGYVKTAQPPYEVSYIGWWPDPLLDFLGPIDVAPGDAQAFWVRVRAPKDQAPGVYEGTLRVEAANAPASSFPLSVEVYPFAMPDASPLPTAMSIYDQYARKFTPDGWDKAVTDYVDFLADYYIDYDSLYRRGAPDFEILKRLDAQGRLVAFNLGYFYHDELGFKPVMTDEAFAASMKKLVARIQPAYEGAKKSGLLARAYIYGFDERNSTYFPILERISAALKKAFPEVPVMTTTYDHSFGLESCIESMDMWCPLTPRYDVARADAARAQGKQVWWYICCGPPHPHANWFVEYPAIETRLLMGAMTAKYRPDGFLYYALTRWPNNTKPIEDGPFTTWNPASFKTFNGDGSILCPGPGGKPLSTIRLENFRDGLEDYAYVRILEATIDAKEQEIGAETPDSTDQQWLRNARSLLNVPESLVEDLTKYTHDPEAVCAWRRELAGAIMSAGITPGDPWHD